jgi:peptidoglycan hydrolase-like protein with peptidoglycan-binding domain
MTNGNTQEPSADDGGSSKAVMWIGIAVAAVALVALGAFLINQSDDSDTAAADLTDAIAVIQQEMKDLGYYPGPVDGVYGPATIDAVKAVQADCGIAQDGLYGPETHQCLIDLGGNADKIAAEVIKVVQQEMKDLGYYSGNVDGVYGPATTDAVKLVQAECGLAPDGIYGPQTHQCLIDLGGDA